MVAIRAVAFLTIVTGSTGCSFLASIPDVHKYFHRDDPTTALLGFAYAVEVGEWDYAFESLDANSREIVQSSGRLRLGVWIENEPTTGRNIGDLIVGAVRHRSDVQIEGLYVRAIDVAYSSSAEEFDPEIIIRVFLIREEEAWHVDLASTIQWNFPPEIEDE